MIYPDVYYIVFDEMSGFDIMHEYWGYNDVDTFVNYLESKGFYVAEKSKASSTNTYHELANRLNYESYPFNSSDYREYWNEDLNHIANNKVMDFFKSLGYTDVVFDEDYLYQQNLRLI